MMGVKYFQDKQYRNIIIEWGEKNDSKVSSDELKICNKKRKKNIFLRLYLNLVCSVNPDRSNMESYTAYFYLSNYAFFRYLSIAKILGTLPNMSNICFRWDDPSELMMCKLINQNNHFGERSAVLEWKIIN